MLFPSNLVREQRIAILREFQAGALGEAETAERMLRNEPDYGPAFTLWSHAKAESGDLAEAESLSWKGLDLQPCEFAPYLSLSDIRRKQDPDDVLAGHLMQLGMWKLSFAEEIPDGVAQTFQGKSDKLDFKDPETYEMFATAVEVQNRDTEVPADVRDRLLPYRLLNDLERQAPEIVDISLLREILANSARCAPLWRNALRDWARSATTPSDTALLLIVALLGEIAGPEILDELLELATFDDNEIFLHAHWAIWRIGQRFPAVALAKFRAATTGASLSLRCALAEQIDLLPKTDGIVPALLDLLEGVAASGNDPDAAYLLMAVTQALAELGEDETAVKVFARYQADFPKKGRKLLQGYVNSEEGFVTKLVAEEIDAYDIEDICIRRVYIEDLDEDAEDFEDDEDDEEQAAEPHIAAVRPERNDPCWCGSGKKYKKCHLAVDEEAPRSGRNRQPEQPPDDPFYQTMFQKLLDSSKEIHSRADFLNAHQLYFGLRPDEMDSEETDVTGFFEWYLFDFRSSRTGRTVVEEYRKRRGPRLGDRELALLDSWIACRFGVFEVQSIREGSGVELQDLFAGDRFFVHDVSTSRSAVRWDCMITRVQDYEGQRIFAGNGFLLARTLLPRFLAMVEEESRQAGQTPAEFVRANSHRWYRVLEKLHEDQLSGMRMVNAEGDDIEFCSATYRVINEEALADTLAGLEFFEDTTETNAIAGVRHFGWLETGVKDGGPRRSYGHIEIRVGRLRLECTSRRRLGIGRQLLEKNAGSFLQHQGDVFESLNAARQRMTREGPPKEKHRKLPAGVEKEVVLKAKADHYATWPDESLPALDGQTPRMAVRTEVGRASVENLIRMMENGEERLRKEGKPAFDFSALRETLGLQS